ncbi:MAG: putative toxin-antitoxin system toxin component, PIN family [Deltaproteobacteria bacterium]
MKVLFDTNVLIAAFIAHGTSSEVFDHCLSEHSIFTSQWILDELEEKLTKKFRFHESKVNNIIKFIDANSEMVEPARLNENVCRDRDDDNVLAAALEAKADCIVTGDKDLLILKNFRGIKIISPSDFWEFEVKR